MNLLSLSFPRGSDSKESACNTGDLDLIPGLGRSGEGNGNALQYSCLENSMEPAGLQSMGLQSRTGLRDKHATTIVCWLWRAKKKKKIQKVSYITDDIT